MCVCAVCQDVLRISQEVSGDLQREVARRRAELNRARWSQASLDGCGCQSVPKLSVRR